MSFGEKLQQLRKEKGLSQEDLAYQLNVSRQAVSKWESQNGYPEMEKMILISELFQVSLDYLLKEDYDDSFQKTDTSYYLMSKQKIDDYIQIKKSFALKMALSVSFMIMGLLIPILCSNTPYETWSGFGFLIIIGISIFVIMVAALSKNPYQNIEDQEIKMSFSDLQELQEQYQQFHSHLTLAIAGCVLLIIVSLACVALLTETHFANSQWIPAQFMLCVAIAVFFFIYYGILDGVYKFLVHNKEYVKDKQIQKQQSSIFGITMPLAAMLYCVMGLTWNWWHPGWIIFPITAFISLGIDYLIHRK